MDSAILSTMREVTPEEVTEALAKPKRGRPKGKRIIGGNRSPYETREDGIWFIDRNLDNPRPDLFICSPMEVVANTRESDGEGWGYLLVFSDPEGNQKEWPLPASMLSGSGDEYRAILLDKGLRIGGKGAQYHLSQFIQAAKAEKFTLCVSRVGWHGETFVLPDASFGGGEERVILQRSDGSDHAFHVAGSLKEWQETIAKKCIGNSRLVFALAAAFTPPLLAITGDEGGGFTFTGMTSKGKTTLLEVAASVWGGPAKKYMKQWRTTANALEAVAEWHCDALLILDELAQGDAREVGEIAYQLANGSGKMRANRKGGLRKTASARTFFLSSGEIDLKEHMRGGGKQIRGGQETRIVSIPIDAGKHMGAWENLHGEISPGDFSIDLKAQVKHFFGSPCRAFLEALIKRDRQEIADNAKAIRTLFLEGYVPANAASEVARIAGRFALVAMAGELAIDMEILPWPQGEAINAAVECFTAWLEVRGTAGSSDTENAIDQVRLFLETHGDSRFPLKSDGDWSKTINRAGFRDNVGEEAIFLILPQTFKQDVCKGHNHSSVAKELEKRGYLIAEKGGRLDKKTRLPGIENGRAYHVKASILGSD